MNFRSISACVLALAFLAVSGKTAFAQDRGQDHRGQDNHGQDNNGHNNAPAVHDQDRGHSFNDQDRQATRDWYQQHRRNPGHGWRQRDRLSPAMQARLHNGQRLDSQLRSQIHWIPADLSRRYGPAPRGYRYAMIGGNVVMLDDGYVVRDLFSITLQF